MKRSKVALVLAGGGITGAVYEVGALRAINNLLRDLTVNDFDIYVGTSAGALICALIANGFSPEEIIQTLDNRHPEIGGIHVTDIFRADLAAYLHSLSNIPRALWRLAAASFKHPFNLAISDMLWELARVLPAGLYDSEALERYVRRILEMPGRCNRFDFLEKKLFIVATELDTGARAVFGQGGKGIVPISRAVAASSAIPVIYRPVRIFGKDYVDGGLHGTASLDLAIEAGAKLVICINSMVPLNAERAFPNQHYMRTHGIQAIVNQTVRTLLHSTLRYHIKNLKAKYPDVDILLIQPEWDDERMFSHYPMHFASRLALAEHGFFTVMNGLMQRFDYYQQILDRHGIELKSSIGNEEFNERHPFNSDGSHPHSRQNALRQSALPRRLVLAEPSVVRKSTNGEPSFNLQHSLNRLEQNLERLERLLEKSD